jgi:ribosome assembly protein YihI (activator of Der GTPase)
MTFDMVVWAVGSVASVLGIYMRMEMKLKELDIRVKSLETTDQKMNDKLDRIMELMNEIRLELKDKADR